MRFPHFSLQNNCPISVVVSQIIVINLIGVLFTWNGFLGRKSKFPFKFRSSEGPGMVVGVQRIRRWSWAEVEAIRSLRSRGWAVLGGAGGRQAEIAVLPRHRGKRRDGGGVAAQKIPTCLCRIRHFPDLFWNILSFICYERNVLWSDAPHRWPTIIQVWETISILKDKIKWLFLVLCKNIFLLPKIISEFSIGHLVGGRFVATF